MSFLNRLSHRFCITITLLQHHSWMLFPDKTIQMQRRGAVVSVSKKTTGKQSKRMIKNMRVNRCQAHKQSISTQESGWDDGHLYFESYIIRTSIILSCSLYFNPNPFFFFFSCFLCSPFFTCKSSSCNKSCIITEPMTKRTAISGETGRSTGVTFTPTALQHANQRREDIILLFLVIRVREDSMDWSD